MVGSALSAFLSAAPPTSDGLMSLRATDPMIRGVIIAVGGLLGVFLVLVLFYFATQLMESFSTRLGRGNPTDGE